MGSLALNIGIVLSLLIANSGGLKNTIGINDDAFYLSEKQLLDTVLTELFHTAGISHPEKGKPEIAICFDKSLKIAQYDYNSNKINIAVKVLEFAKAKNKVEKKHLYLQIIGHELGHYFMIANGKSFDHPSRSFDHINSLEESEADFYGVFTGMLAGYSQLKYYIDTNIQSLYECFDLEDDLNGYPPLSERKAAARKALLRADSLYQLFQLANGLVAAEYFDPAINIYQYLLKYYRGAEFHNNLGILYTLRGISQNFTNDKNWKRYFFPIELDLESRLSNVRTDGQLLNKPNNHWYDKAQDEFAKARKINHSKERYCLNEAVALILSHKFKDAISILKKFCPSNGNYEQLLYGIIHAMTDNEDQAKIIFENLKTSTDPQIIQLAKMNKRVLTNTTKNRVSTPICIREYLPSSVDFVPFGELVKNSVESIMDSDFQYARIDSSYYGSYFSIWKKYQLKLSIQYVRVIPCGVDFLPYQPSTMGINYQSYIFEDKFRTKRKWVRLGNKRQMIISQF